MTKKMKLEYGKRYRSRGGQETTPLFQTPEPIFALQQFAGHFIDEKGEGFRTWAPDGATMTGWTGFDHDLIEEIEILPV